MVQDGDFLSDDEENDDNNDDDDDSNNIDIIGDNNDNDHDKDKNTIFQANSTDQNWLYLFFNKKSV